MLVGSRGFVYRQKGKPGIKRDLTASSWLLHRRNAVLAFPPVEMGSLCKVTRLRLNCRAGVTASHTHTLGYTLQRGVFPKLFHWAKVFVWGGGDSLISNLSRLWYSGVCVVDSLCRLVYYMWRSVAGLVAFLGCTPRVQM